MQQEPTTPPDGAFDDDAVDGLLAQVLELPLADQAAALDGLCRAHATLASEIRSRYRALEAVGLVTGDDPPGQAFPSHLGEFRLLEPLGHGGMGVVYRAVEEPLQRQVALKLIRPEHLYFPGAQRWFRREVEAIAQLQHPAIVPIYRAGDANGIPYFAMELVAGVSLAQVVRNLQRTPQERLRPAALAAAAGVERSAATQGAFALSTWADACVAVVLAVGEALAHAHARGVVHRDVKPSNVMLARDGRVRLLDFGLAARAGSAKLTRTGVAMGSLTYMSPEQVRGEAVDVRTDVYSLGVTLYELLTLQEPFYDESSDALRAQILRGQPKPVRLLNRKVPWDVETVCLHAMARELQHRYRDMTAFVDDLRCLLQRQPIRARRPGLLLRTTRLVQRRPTVSAVVVSSALLAIALPTGLWLQQRSANATVRAALTRAETDAETARQTIDFLVGAVRLADPERTLGETVTVRQMVDDAAVRLRAELREQPRVQAALLGAIGRVYENLGLYDKASALLTEVLPMLESAPPAAAYEARVTLARVQRALGRPAVASRTLDGAEAAAPASLPLAARAALRTERAFLAYEHGDAEAALRTLAEVEATCRHSAGAESTLLEVLRARLRLLSRDEKYREVLKLLPEVEGLATQLLGPDSAASAALLHERGRALRAAGEPQAALAAFEAAEAATRRIFGDEHLRVAEIEESAAFALADLERLEAGRDKLVAAAAIRRAALHDNHPAVARNLTLQGELALGAGDTAQADALFARAEDMLGRNPGADPGLLASVAAQRAVAAARAGKIDDSLAFGKVAGERYAKLPGGDEDHAAFLERYAFVLLGGGRVEEARRAADECVALRRRLYPADHPRVAHSLQVLAQVCVSQGEYQAALQHVDAALAIAAARLGSNAGLVGFYHAVRAQALSGLERYGEAGEAFDAGIAAMVQARGKDDRSLLEVLVNCGMCLRHAHRDADARDRFVEACRIADLTLAPEHRLHVTVRRMLARTLLALGDRDRAVEVGRQAVACAQKTLAADDRDRVAAERVLADALTKD